jgi:hypothetical protein
MRFGQERGGPHNQRSAHAVTLGSDLFCLVHFFLRIEEGNVSGGILLGIPGRVHGRHQRSELRHIVGILKVEGGGIRERSFGYAIKGIGHEDGISADMDKAVKFYRDVIGLKLKFESPGWSEFVTGETILALHPASDKNPAGKVELGFTVADAAPVR